MQQIADEVQALAGTEHVAVVATGEHLCMTMRGIRRLELMRLSVLRGAFRDDAAARAEFLTIAKQP